MTFNADDQIILDSIAKWLARDVAPHAMRMEHDDTYPTDMVAQMKDLGRFGAVIAPEWGGLGLSASLYARIVTMISEEWMSLTGIFNSHLMMAMCVEKYGTEAQKKQYLPRFCTGELRGGVGLTEPDAGTDLQGIRTRAVKDGDHYIISGQKIWATGAGAKNNFINVYVKTDPKANYRQGMSLFLVDNTSPGLEVRKLDMLGRRSVGTYELTFNDVRVPAENLVGGENNGWKCVLAGLQAERAVAAACDCGSARGVFEMALAYAKERKQFTKQIGTFQALAHMLADMQTEIEAAWSLTLRAAAMVSAGQDALREITMAKLAASEAYVKAANNGMQIMGGFGYSMEFDMQRHYRDARAATIAAGTSQIQRNLIAGLMGLKV